MIAFFLGCDYEEVGVLEVPTPAPVILAVLPPPQVSISGDEQQNSVILDIQTYRLIAVDDRHACYLIIPSRLNETRLGRLVRELFVEVPVSENTEAIVAEHAEAVVDFVKRGDRPWFDELARAIGIRVDDLQDVWDGVKKRLTRKDRVHHGT